MTKTVSYTLADGRKATAILTDTAHRQLKAMGKISSADRRGFIETWRILPKPETAASEQQKMQTAGEQTRPGDRWHCGNRHLHTQAALHLIAKNGVTDVKAMQWLDDAAYVAGPDFCATALQPEFPF